MLNVGDAHAEHIRQRQHGHAWANFSYLPAAIAGPLVAKYFRLPTTDEWVERYSGLLPIVGGAAGWKAASLIARFDTGLAHTVMHTPISDEQGFDTFRQLPAWTVAIPMPWLAPSVVAFVWIDAGTTPDEAGDADQLFIAVVNEAHDPVLMNLDCGKGTITAAIAAKTSEPGSVSFDDREPLSPHVALRFHYGDNANRLLERIVALVVYLCSDKPEVTQRPPAPMSPDSRKRTDQRFIELLDVGLNISAAQDVDRR